MNELQRGILTLLKSAVTGEPGILPEDFSLEAALPVLRRHNLQLLAYEGALRCGIPDSQPRMVYLFQVYCKHLLRSEAQMKMVERLYAAFEENGIDYMPLKGCNMKALYPKPELRIMGDADILIRAEQYEKIRPIVAALGMTENIDSDHDYGWESDALKLELHTRLIPAHHSLLGAYYGDGWRFARKQTGFRYAMSLEDGFIFQFVHYARHYCDGGAGCRHVLDLWVYLNAYPDMDMAYIRAELEKLQLLAFFENICRLMAFWFSGGESDDRTEFMTGFIFDSGSWGRWKNRVLSSELRNVHSGGTVRDNKRQQVLWSLLPPLEKMTDGYPVLKRAPWLLPVMWVARGVRALLFRRKHISITYQYIRKVNQDSVDEFQQALDYVGLTSRFGK